MTPTEELRVLKKESERDREMKKGKQIERDRDRKDDKGRERDLDWKNKEYKKEKIFYMDVLKTIHKKISNQKMKSKERDKSILEYVQCMYNNVHTY